MKLIVSDLDGTIVHRNHFSKETLETIRKIQDSEHLFTVATGRHLNVARDVVKAFNIKHPVICSNGAVIYDFNKEEIIFQQSVEHETAKKVTDLCRAKQLDVLLYTTKLVYAVTDGGFKKFTRLVDAAHVIKVKYEALPSIIEEGVTKILVIEFDQDKINAFKQALSAFDDLSFVQSQKEYLDIGHKNATKGAALLRLAELLDVKAEDCIAIGDQDNDVTMIENAGLGIAIGSGHPVLKEKADFVTKAFEDNGFAYAMNQLLFKDNQ